MTDKDKKIEAYKVVVRALRGQIFEKEMVYLLTAYRKNPLLKGRVGEALDKASERFEATTERLAEHPETF